MERFKVAGEATLCAPPASMCDVMSGDFGAAVQKGAFQGTTSTLPK